MAIDLRTMYIQNAHRLSLYELKDSIRNNRSEEIHSGQLFQLDADGKWEYADGTKKAYPTLNSRYGTGGSFNTIQYELSEGRDDVTRSGKIACLKGNFEIATDQYDKTQTYVPGDALHPMVTAGMTGTALIDARGKVTKYNPTNPNHKVQNIIGYVTQAPNSSQPELTTGMSANYTNPNVATYLRYEG